MNKKTTVFVALAAALLVSMAIAAAVTGSSPALRDRITQTLGTFIPFDTIPQSNNSAEINDNYYESVALQHISQTYGIPVEELYMYSMRRRQFSLTGKEVWHMEVWTLNRSLEGGPEPEYDVFMDLDGNIMTEDEFKALEKQERMAYKEKYGTFPVRSPIADFMWDAWPGDVGESIIFNASISFDPQGYDITSYLWDFGDEDTGTGKTVSHTYSSPGEYKVTLTVTNSVGGSDSVTKTVIVKIWPTANFSYTPISDDEIFFTDQSSDDGTIKGWYWDFGDGETCSAQNTVTHTYTAGEQDYEVTLAVVDDDGLIDSVTKTVHAGTGPVNQPPVANFTFSCSGPTCDFTDTSTDPEGDNITGWYWDFGDGHTSEEQNPTHGYLSTGEHMYTVTLFVVDEKGLASSVSKNVCVVNLNAPPVADFSYTVEGLVVTFNGSATDPDDDDIIGWIWEFGDGHGESTKYGSNYTVTVSSQNTTHEYSCSGKYSVTLTVVDERLASRRVSKIVSVVDPAHPGTGTPNSPPVPDFTYTVEGLIVNFYGSATDPDDDAIIEWIWEFGDGYEESIEYGSDYTVWRLNTTHGYLSTGEYMVTLYVGDERGLIGNVSKKVIVSS